MSPNRIQLLNFLGGLCAVLILAAVILGQVNGSLNRSLAKKQNENQPKLNSAQQKYTLLENLAVRIAQGAQQDPVLRELLIKHDLKVNLNVNGQTKQVP